MRRAMIITWTAGLALWVHAGLGLAQRRGDRIGRLDRPIRCSSFSTPTMTGPYQRSRSMPRPPSSRSAIPTRTGNCPRTRFDRRSEAVRAEAGEDPDRWIAAAACRNRRWRRTKERSGFWPHSTRHVWRALRQRLGV